MPTKEPTREEDLRERTYKSDPDLIRRVYRTLADERKSAKAFAFLVKHLHEKGVLSEDDLDAMLLDAIGPRTY